jgi:hypothetical protein
MSTADILFDSNHEPPKTQAPADETDGPDDFAGHTRRVIDEIVNNVVTEFNQEIGELRKELDDFEQVLISRAAQTKDTMTGYVELVRAGHALTRHVRERVQSMCASKSLDEE